MRVQTFLNVHKGFEELENWNVFKRLKYEKSVNLWNLTSLKSCWNLKVLKRLEFQTFVDEWKFSSLEMFGISNAYKGFCFEKLGKALFFKGLGFETLEKVWRTKGLQRHEIWNVWHLKRVQSSDLRSFYKGQEIGRSQIWVGQAFIARDNVVFTCKRHIYV